MKKLSQEAFARARTFVMDQGRELDGRLFEFHFATGSKDAVLEALAHYQNDDGGFGRGLEPDLGMAGSSAIATTVGFQILREVGACGDHALVQQGIKYLLATYEEQRQAWPIIPPEANNDPRAPWWNYEKSAEFFGNFLANPRAAIIGYLHDYNTLVPTDLLAQLTASVINHLESLPDDKMDMHDLLCAICLAESATLEGSERQRVLEKIKRAAVHTVTKDPQKWSEYSTKPLWLAPAPDAPLAAVLTKEVQMNLDFEIEHQGKDGSWSPFWSWGEEYPEAWQEARRQWQAKLTVDVLKSLKAFGRLEGVG